MSYIGDFKVAAVIDKKFTTRSFSTGAPTTLAGTPVISIYKDNDTTQTTTGVTLTVDFDGVTGLHNIHIDTSNAFYTAGSNFQMIITTGTVGGVSVVGEVVGSFSIEATSALRPTTAGRTLDVSATGEAGVDWGNVGSPTTANNLSGTNIKTDQIVASVTGAVGSVTGAVGSVTGAVGSVTGNVGGNVTGTVGSVVGAVGSVTGNIGGNVVGSVASVTGNVGGNVTGSVGSVTGLTASNLDATISSRASAANLVTAQADLDDIQTRLPAALIGGRMNSDVEAINAVDVQGAGVLGDKWRPV